MNYSDLFELIADRKEAVLAFDQLLRKDTTWLEAPASTRFHLSRSGGLLEHSVSVARILLKIKNLLAPYISDESCVITGLYHDVGKVGLPGKAFYIPNTDKWQIQHRGIRYIVNKDLAYMDIASRSLMLVSTHVTLSEDEAQAIRYHDGQYIPENQGVAHRETKLTRLLQYADNWSGCALEDENELNHANEQAEKGEI
jgi:hypothetical protein